MLRHSTSTSFCQVKEERGKPIILRPQEQDKLLTQVTKGLFIPWPSGSTSQLFSYRTGKVNIEEMGAVQLQSFLQLLHAHVCTARTKERKQSKHTPTDWGGKAGAIHRHHKKGAADLRTPSILKSRILKHRKIQHFNRMPHDTANAALLGAGSATEGFGWGWKALMQAWRSSAYYSSFVGEFYFQKRFYNHGDNRNSMK